LCDGCDGFVSAKVRLFEGLSAVWGVFFVVAALFLIFFDVFLSGG